MNRFARWTTLASALGFLAMAGVAGAEEEPISVKRLPKAVIKAVKARFPKAEIKEASEEEEDDETTYEVSLEFKGQAIDVALKPDGTILEIEKEVPVSALPRAVKKALAARYHEAKIEKVEEVTKGEGGPVYYEVVITTEVVLSAKGKVIEAEEDEDEDDEKESANVKKSKKGEDDDEKASVKHKKSKRGEKDEDDKKTSAKVKKSKSGGR